MWPLPPANLCMEWLPRSGWTKNSSEPGQVVLTRSGPLWPWLKCLCYPCGHPSSPSPSPSPPLQSKSQSSSILNPYLHVKAHCNIFKLSLIPNRTTLPRAPPLHVCGHAPPFPFSPPLDHIHNATLNGLPSTGRCVKEVATTSLMYMGLS